MSLMIAFVFAAFVPSPPDCSYDRDAMQAMDLETFDETLESGWRTVGNIEGCELEAAELIADWRAENAPGQPALMSAHEGQLRAAAGQEERAAELMELALAETTFPADRLYRRATIAYLRNDKAMLVEMRERLAALPKPEGFDEAAAKFEKEYGYQISWPSNLDVVDGLIACFDEPYRVAYSQECRPDAS